ncbi:hypothetical protein HJG60_007725 [Phyllostomus discolor]|uniref:Uncharacterized protein n=1 Tax=Phyllostomus discolor TaxID=89673 RepID=A0A834EY38_9CHIR|nr:hypothetical protein HJG60_007725 [Phyllostomus discolor]
MPLSRSLIQPEPQFPYLGSGRGRGCVDRGGHREASGVSARMGVFSGRGHQPGLEGGACRSEERLCAAGGGGAGAAEPRVLDSGAALPFTSCYSSALSILRLLFWKKGASPVPTLGTLAGRSARCWACPGHSAVCTPASGLFVLLPKGPPTLGPASSPLPRPSLRSAPSRPQAIPLSGLQAPPGGEFCAPLSPRQQGAVEGC